MAQYEDYLGCTDYENQPAHPTENGFTAFYHTESQRYFFALLDADGKVLLKSEGYPQAAARENGIQSVIKNRTNRDFYSVKEEGGKYFVSLRAANYREIARSCSCESEAVALEMIPYLTGEKTRGGKAAEKERANDRLDDDYLACKEYEGHPDVGIDGHAGMVKFTHSNGNHYFAWYDDENNLLMRSEGYPTTSARDKGLESVVKNRGLEERYATFEKMGRHFVILKAGNHQEIARSCPYDSAATAQALYPSARAEAARLKAEAARLKAAEEAAAAAAASAAASAKSGNHDDDYLACRQYDGHDEADENGFVRFQHTNNLYYFAWLDDNGRVKMRSEGYPTVAARDNGMNSVMRNRDNKDRYEIKEMMGKHFVILKAGNHQEIARSCPKDSIDAVGAMFPLLGLGGAVAAAEIGSRGLGLTDNTPSVSEPAADVEDDYLPCREYHGHMTAPRDGFRVFISQRTGKYYFAVVDEDDDVSLRSEGHMTAKERDSDMEDVVKNMLVKERYEIKKIGLNHYFIVLRNADGKEIARSCAYDSLAAVYAAAPFLNPDKAGAKVGLGAPLAMAAAAAAATAAIKAEPKPEPKPVVAAAPIAPVAEEAMAGGLPSWLWWLLLPLLALLAWWLFGKGCGKTETVVPKAAVTTTPAVDTAKIVETPKATAATAAAAATPTAPSCDLNWIFFDFDKDNIRSDAQKELAEMAKILKEHKDYVGVLSAHTDIRGSDAYNEALSSRRATNAKAALVKMGIDASRVLTEKSGKRAPVAKNTDDDNGRKYNRRVELYIRDKSGKDICQSIPPAIPADLKAN
ncbi:MAG: DUF1508 domain-containing protein [Saprospiraceae bacterium]|nr:DUF1508 domain-containing protein [Saprospiraceae bacterium]